MKMLSNIGNRLDDLKQRLRNTSAGIELSVPMHRTSYRAVQLEHQLDKMHQDIDDLEEEKEEEMDNLAKLGRIIDEIQAELDEAYETDETEMWSNFVHDQPQVVEVEELKTRLGTHSLTHSLTHSFTHSLTH